MNDEAIALAAVLLQRQQRRNDPNVFYLVRPPDPLLSLEERRATAGCDCWPQVGVKHIDRGVVRHVSHDRRCAVSRSVSWERFRAGGDWR